MVFRSRPAPERAGNASSPGTAAGCPAGHSGRETWRGAAGGRGGESARACAVGAASLPAQVFVSVALGNLHVSSLGFCFCFSFGAVVATFRIYPFSNVTLHRRSGKRPHRTDFEKTESGASFLCSGCRHVARRGFGFTRNKGNVIPS